MEIKTNILDKIQYLKDKGAADKDIFDLVSATRGPDDIPMPYHKAIFTAVIRGRIDIKTGGGALGYDVYAYKASEKPEHVIQKLIFELKNTSPNMYRHYITHVLSALKVIEQYIKENEQDKKIIHRLIRMAGILFIDAIDRSIMKENYHEHNALRQKLLNEWTAIVSLLNKTSGA